MYLFDTDVISRTVKADPPACLVERLRKLPRALQFTTAINVAEIHFGAWRTGRREEILQAFERTVFPRLTILPFNTDSARIYGRLKASLEAHGVVRSEPDLRIAAIAVQHGLTVVSGNVRHFTDIPGLRVENWLS